MMSKSLATPAGSILTTKVGTAKDMAKELRHVGDDDLHQYILMELREPVSSRIIDLTELLKIFLSTAADMVERRNLGTHKAMLELLVQNVPRPAYFLAQVRMEAKARNAVLESTDWLTAAQVAEVAGLSTTNPSAQPNKWKRDRQIFAITRNNVDYFPRYALDPDASYRPRKALADVLAVFGNHKDGWGIATWFASLNSFLGALRPMDLLATEPARVVEAARDEVEGPVHG